MSFYRYFHDPKMSAVMIKISQLLTDVEGGLAIKRKRKVKARNSLPRGRIIYNILGQVFLAEENLPSRMYMYFLKRKFYIGQFFYRGRGRGYAWHRVGCVGYYHTKDDCAQTLASQVRFLQVNATVKIRSFRQRMVNVGFRGTCKEIIYTCTSQPEQHHLWYQNCKTTTTDIQHIKH